MGLLIALPIAAAIAILDRRKIEEFLFLAIGLIVMCILICGFSGNTLKGVYAAVGLGGISLLYCICMLFIDRERFKKSVITPGFFGGMICIIIAAFMFAGKTDLGTDPDTFWAHAPKILNMYRYSNLGESGTRGMTYALLYTAPVYTGWCYFCNVLWLEYSDAINLWARQIFSIAALMPFFAVIEKKDKRTTLLMCMFISALPLLVDTTYNFYPDIPVGAAMVYGTVTTIKFYRDKDKKFDWGYLLGICIWLALISVMKRAGGLYLYGMIGIASIYTIDRIRSKERKESFLIKVLPIFFMSVSVMSSLYYTYYRYVHYEQEILYTIMPAASLFLFMFMGIFCAICKKLLEAGKYILLTILGGVYFIGGGYAVRLLAVIIREKVHHETAENVGSVFFQFFSSYFEHSDLIESRFRDGWQLSDFAFVLILFIILFAIRVLVSKDKLSYFGTTEDLDNSILTMIAGYTIYILFYCYIYMERQGGYIADEGMGRNIRYLGPAVMVTVSVVVYELFNIKNFRHSRVIAVTLIAFYILLPVNPFRFLALESHTGWEKYDALYEQAGVHFEEDDRVLLVGPYHSIYYAFPAVFELVGDEVKGAEVSVENWKAQILSGRYDYLVLEDYSWNFPDTYQELFEGGKRNIQKWAIYDVVIDGDKVKLVKRG